MAKPFSSIFVLGLTAISAFSVLFATHLITLPILLTRENQRYLDLLKIDSLEDYQVGEAILPTDALLTAGITEIKPFFQNDILKAVAYTGVTTGYAPGLSFRLGIKEGIITNLVIDKHGESAGYGAYALSRFPEVLKDLAIDEESLWMASLLSVSLTGVSFSITTGSIVNVLKAIRIDYQERVDLE
jgi:hypothetical protein